MFAKWVSCPTTLIKIMNNWMKSSQHANLESSLVFLEPLLACPVRMRVNALDSSLLYPGAVETTKSSQLAKLLWNEILRLFLESLLACPVRVRMNALDSSSIYSSSSKLPKTKSLQLENFENFFWYCFLSPFLRARFGCAWRLLIQIHFLQFIKVNDNWNEVFPTCKLWDPSRMPGSGARELSWF